MRRAFPNPDDLDAIEEYWQSFLEERFWSRVLKWGPDDCWHWMGRMSSDGYGLVSLLGRQIGAHVASFWSKNDGAVEWEVIRHTCDNRGCVNPRHLIPGTYLENTRDMVERGRSKWQTGREMVEWTPPVIRLLPADVPRELSAGEMANERIAKWRDDIAWSKHVLGLGLGPEHDPLQGLYKPERRELELVRGRCREPKAKDYDRFGGRGVWVWTGWDGPSGFVKFLEHAGPRPSNRYALRRVDDRDHFRPGNVQWWYRRKESA